VNTIDISALPPPQVVEMPEFKALKQQRIAELQAICPTFNALVESDPAIKLIEIEVYREMVNVERFNSGVRAVLLPYAKGCDLDQLGNNFDVPRQVVTPADDTTIPPTEAVMEDDDRYRHRIRLSWYARNTAGSLQAYEYFALSADPTVLDARPYGPQEWPESVSPGEVHVYVLSSDGDGTPSGALLQAVYDTLSPDDVIPLTDYLTVLAPAIVNYEVVATLYIADGPDADTVVEAATKAMQRYADNVHVIGQTVSIAGVYHALKQPGVDDVLLATPTANIDIAKDEVSYCTGITLAVVRSSDDVSVSAAS
jgi:phage-related baseplate assembly protein